MRLFQRFTIAFLFLVCFFSCKTDSKTNNTSSEKYRSFVDAMDAQGIATGNLLVYEDGEVIFRSAHGLRSIDPIDSLEINSQFRLASVSKQFTGMSIMKLKEQGKIDYDQKVNTILSDFPYDNITVRHLLHHTSGLTDYERIIADHFVPEDPDKQYILGNNEILEVFYNVDPDLDFQPGERWEYSNTGYLVLATIVETISGQHFRDFLKEQIFDPIGMTSTTLYQYQIEPDPNMPDRVFGYRTALNQKDLILNDYNIVNDVRGDGGIFSTLDDLYKWNMALVNYEIIDKSYLDEAWSSGKTNSGENTGYGFGWFLDYDPGNPVVVNHSGGWVGFVTFLQNEVDTKSGFVILTNNSSDYVDAIFGNMFALSSGKDFEIPKKSIRAEMAKKLFEENTASALAHYTDLKTNNPDHYNFDESELNILGYTLMNEDRLEDALQIFELNIKQYPESANPYDSFGDALLAKGDTIRALENFKKCFSMDSTLTYSKDKIDALEAIFNSEIQD